jgi:hypothetical protein
MPNSLRRPSSTATGLLLLSFLSLSTARAVAQEAVPLTPFQRAMEHFDLGVSVTGVVSSDVSGIEQRDVNGYTLVTTPGTGITKTTVTGPTLLSISPSSTISELITLRYTVKPLIGFEYNFANSRFNQNYTFANTSIATTVNTSTTPATTTVVTTNNNPSILPGAQVGVHEISFGYVAHLRKIYGIQPYVGAGGGTLHFTPTPNGGEGLPFQYRAMYYYNFGAEQSLTGSADHFGVRLGFRQLIYLAPDFGTNYLTITRRTRTSEPTFGFFARF